MGARLGLCMHFCKARWLLVRTYRDWCRFVANVPPCGPQGRWDVGSRAPHNREIPREWVALATRPDVKRHFSTDNKVANVLIVHVYDSPA